MKYVLFYHSLVSDWNHGNAHFLRGIVAELIARGHDVDVYEPADGGSRRELVAEHGEQAVARFARRFPRLRSHTYDPEHFDPMRLVHGADVVMVHERNAPEVVARIGRVRRHDPRFRLLFHDTHHRSVTAPEELARYDLSDYDAVLAFGAAVRQRYLEESWHDRVFVWHEAADTRIFAPRQPRHPRQDLVWVGNWCDGERAEELDEFLISPARDLRLIASVHGVRYPPDAVAKLREAGITYRGWVPNWRVPELFARAALTVHVPRRPYARALPGIPTIRVFEALACGIPLISSEWSDSEHLFRPGIDYLTVRSGAEMRDAMESVLKDPELAMALSRNGVERIRSRHTCVHRVRELNAILGAIDAPDNVRTLPQRSLAHA